MKEGAKPKEVLFVDEECEKMQYSVADKVFQFFTLENKSIEILHIKYLFQILNPGILSTAKDLQLKELFVG